jgi:hypothetical protein
MKPGYKTSEFWLTFGAMILSAVFASGVLALPGVPPAVSQLIGLVAVILESLGYKVARSFTKASEAKSAASVLPFLKPPQGP